MLRIGKIIICNYCKNGFYVSPYRIKTAKYCSRKCKGIAECDAGNKPCEVCGKQFYYISSRANKAKYCSRKCYYKGQHSKGTIIYKCKYCFKKFRDAPSHKRIYCSKACTGKSRKDIWKAKYTTVRKAIIRRGMMKECQRCGFSKYIEILGIHHKDRNRNNNDLSNLEILCPNCHSIEHLKHIAH